MASHRSPAGESPSRPAGSHPAGDTSRWAALAGRTDTDHLHTLLAAVVEGSDDAIFAKDLDGVILTWNRGAERIYGYTAEEIVGSNVAVLVPPDMESDVPEIMARLRRGKGMEQYETRRVTRDGRHLRVSLTISPIQDERGEVVGASTTARDVTALRRAEARRALLGQAGEVLAAVLDEREMLRRLARLVVGELADYCVTYLVEPDGAISRAGLAHADPAAEELVGRLGDTRPPSMDDAVGAGKVIRTGEPILAPVVSPELLESAAGHDTEYLELLGRLGPTSSMILPLAARGRTLGAVAFAATARSGLRYGPTDLQYARELADRAALAVDNARLYSESRTEVERRRGMEEVLRRRYEQLRVVYGMTEAVARAGALDEIYHEAVRTLQEGVGADRASILRFDGDGVLRFVAWTGLSEEYRRRVEGHTPWSPDTRDPEPIVVPDVASGDLEDGLRETLRSEGIAALAFVPLTFGGRLLGKFMLYFDEPHYLASEELDLARTVAGTIGFAIVRVEDEQRVRAAKEAAERASQAKSQFLGVMSHELRTPLNSVIGYADLLLMEAKGPVNPEQREFIERIKGSARHQLGLVEEILTYARIEAGRADVQIVPTDLGRSVADVIEFVRPEAERKGLRLRSELPDPAPRTRTDPARVRQILLNLAGNAVKFTDEGDVTLRVRVDGEEIVLEVEDTGPGIADDQLDRIWEPFAQGGPEGDGPRGGTGLGLAIARRLTELLQGRLTLDSTAGEGSLFALRLPVAPGE